jgi:bifunctional oligoribonuclease and PAP phosphatase NrnA
MSEYISNTTVDAVAKRILAAKRVMITTHTKPDGDAMGSTLALKRALNQKNIESDIYLAGPIERNLLTIAGDTPICIVEQSPPHDDYDLVVVCDTGSWSQLEPVTDFLKPRFDHVIVIDHHAQGNEVGAMTLVDPRVVSTTAMLLPVLERMNARITGGINGIAEALFTGVATDSGWFRHGNAGSDAFALAGLLLACGVDKSRLYEILEETRTPQRLALQARGLASLEYVCDGTVALQSLRIEDFKETGAGPEDLTGLVNEPMSVGAVRVSILLTQNSPRLTKVSFRSKPPRPGTEADDFVNVNVLANKFGGGGHVHAAGARLPVDLDQAKAMVIAALG